MLKLKVIENVGGDVFYDIEFDGTKEEFLKLEKEKWGWKRVPGVRIIKKEYDLDQLYMIEIEDEKNNEMILEKSY